VSLILALFTATPFSFPKSASGNAADQQSGNFWILRAKCNYTGKTERNCMMHLSTAWAHSLLTGNSNEFHTPICVANHLLVFCLNVVCICRMLFVACWLLEYIYGSAGHLWIWLRNTPLSRDSLHWSLYYLISYWVSIIVSQLFCREHHCKHTLFGRFFLDDILWLFHSDIERFLKIA